MHTPLFFQLLTSFLGSLFWIMTSFLYAAPPANFTVDPVLSGLTQPVAMTFLPDGRGLVLQRTGEILIIDPSTVPASSAGYMTIANVEFAGERGLLDIALDPDFATNGYFYLFYSPTSPAFFRLSRFTHQENSGGLASRGDLASEVLIWSNDVGYGDCCHNGGGLDIGPDGKLYLTIGDRFNANGSQDLTTYNGSIIRLNLDGSIPDGTDGYPANPFIDGPGGNKDEIWAYGLRNPFRAHFDQSTGRMFIGEVGGNDQSTAWEDIHLSGSDATYSGVNYGWPGCEGAPPYANFPSCAVSGTLGDPVFAYEHSGSGASVSGGIVYRGSNFPASYDGAYFYGDYVRNFIRYLTFDAAGTTVTGDFSFDPAAGQPVAFEVGPDGYLYYVDFAGSVKRYVYASGNQAPACVSQTASPNAGVGPILLVNFDAEISDPEDDAVTYEWDFGDGSAVATGSAPAGSGTRSLPTEAHTYTARGLYTVQLKISDPTHTIFCETFTVQVGNPPTATITTPADGSTFQAGDLINFAGTATDPDETLGAANYTWEIVFTHNAHTHPELAPTSGITGGSFNIPVNGHDFLDNTGFEIRLTVTDSDGLISMDKVKVVPDKAVISYRSIPSGLTLVVDGIPRVTPFTLDDLIGFERTVEANTQCLGGLQFDFGSWSQGGAGTQVITTPGSATTYTATFSSPGNCTAPVTNGLVLHLDGDLGITDVAGAITDWADQSGSGNDLNTSWLGNPTLVSAGLNGHDILSFDGADDGLVRSGFSNLPTGNANRSVFSVIRYQSNGWGGVTYGGAACDAVFGLTVSDQGKLAVQSWCNNYPSTDNGNGGGWLTQSVLVNGASFSQFKNGGVVGTGPNTFNTGNTDITIGLEIDYSTFVTMQLAEVMIFDRAVTESERQMIEAYFQAKYFPSEPQLTVISPSPGETIGSSEVTVSWTTTGMNPGDHVHLILDGQMPHTTLMDQNGSYTLSGLSPGSHSVLLQVASVGHQVYANSAAAVNVSFSSNPSGFPVEIGSFKADWVRPREVKMDWVTLSESDNAFFEVQKSEDGIDFRPIAEVEGAGTSTEIHTYTYLDKSEMYPTNYYRLKQVDFNGAYSFSEVISLNLSNLVRNDLVLFPNPASKSIRISLVDNENGGQYRLVIRDMQGRAIREERIELENQQYYSVDIIPFSAGVYQIEMVSSKGVRRYARFVKE